MAKQYVDITWDPVRHRKTREVSINNNINYAVPASTRGIDMLLAKFRGEAYQTEVQFALAQGSTVPKLTKPLSQVKIAFVTDGGLVPAGNPDAMPPVNADKFCIYPFCGAKTLRPEDYTVVHQGYDNQYVQQDPNRLIPLDAAYDAVASGKIAGVFDLFYSTAGVMTSVEKSREFGEKISASLRSSGADGVIVISTCGTSTRCGAHIACEIEKAGIPVVHVTNLVRISQWVGCSRILEGNNICHVFGDPALAGEQEREYRRHLFDKALELLDRVPPDNGCIVEKYEDLPRVSRAQG